MNVRVWVSLAVVLGSVSGGNLCAEDLTGHAGKGEEIYRLYCLNCHGARGRGDGPVAESLTPRPADLTTVIVQKKSEKDLLQIIREGKPGTSMPSWKGELSDQNIYDVLVFLRELGKKVPAP
jgi:mono/diheme cytochrome c family protein